MEELVHSWCVLHHHDQFLLYHHLPGTLCTVTTGRLCTREGVGRGKEEGWKGEGGRDGREKEGGGSFLPLPSPSRLMHRIFHIVKLTLICSVCFRFQGDWYSPEVLPRGD